MVAAAARRNPSTITVTSTSGHMTWRPSTPVVYIGQRSCTGPAADTACDALNFFTSPRTARSWAEQHSAHTGKAVDQARAEALGRSVFGAFLEPPQASGDSAVKTETHRQEREHG
ncbi:organomercurial lyase [Streptomyces sp. Ag109_G2-15]|uniref:organomercurial lyase n=1 Tax=Streptomyces sp. Ag109_G2-15 TaxID=1938850 RepID=UPI0015CF347E